MIFDSPLCFTPVFSVDPCQQQYAALPWTNVTLLSMLCWEVVVMCFQKKFKNLKRRNLKTKRTIMKFKTPVSGVSNFIIVRFVFKSSRTQITHDRKSFIFKCTYISSHVTSQNTMWHFVTTLRWLLCSQQKYSAVAAVESDVENETRS